MPTGRTNAVEAQEVMFQRIGQHERPAARSEPALEQLRLAECFVDELARRVEDSRHDDFAVPLRSYL